MNNINDLFNERDMIIESMGYFNPLILEEHDVILTEGIVGGVVEKIQALWKMIKGWITKLIDFVSSKFRKGKSTTTDNAYEGEHIDNDRKESASKFHLTNKFFEAVDEKNINRLRIMMKKSLLVDLSFKQFNEMSKYVKNIEGMYDEHDDKQCPFEEDKSKWDKNYINKQLTRVYDNFSKKRIEHIKKVITYVYGNEKKNVNESTNVTTSQIIELPKLKNAKKALNDIKKECEKALKEKEPVKIIPKDPKTIRKYFETGGKVKLSSRDKILKDSTYMSYLNSKDCTDQLKSYQKSLDNEYKSLQQEAKNIKDERKSKELLAKARGINVMTQKFLGTAIKCYAHYADLINKAVK